MADDRRHPVDDLLDAVDDRLAGPRLAALEEHLATCDRCRAEFDALRWTKRQLAVAGRAGGDEDAAFESRLRAALDADDRAGRRPWWRGIAVPAAAAALVIAVVWVTRGPDGPSMVEVAARDFQGVQSGDLALELDSADPVTLEARFGAAGLPFPARVFDFGMMDYRLSGGSIRRGEGPPRALFAYRGSGDLALTCQMYEGRVEALPPPDARRVNDGIEFRVYRTNGLTIVFWQEGAIVCVLVANGDTEAAIKLAFAKAVKV